MPTAPSWPKNLNLADYPESVQGQILAKVEAMERFVSLNAIALGILQVLALESPIRIWSNYPRWFRTLPNHGYPSERIVQLVLQHQAQETFLKSPASLLLPKFLSASNSQYGNNPQSIGAMCTGLKAESLILWPGV